MPLTPGRSIAVDRIHVYGTPFFIDAELPIEGARTKDRFRRLMVSQDTGSAIIGPARADLYFGAGKDAGAIAGRIRQQGRFVMLLPRELDMIEAGRAMPLPRPKPEIPPDENAGRQATNAKAEVDAKAKPKSEGKEKARAGEAARSQEQAQAETNVLSDMSRRRQVSDEEQALWQAITRTVLPLKRRRKHAAPAERCRRAEAEARAAFADGIAAASGRRHAEARTQAPTPKEPALAPLDRRAKQKLARGTQAIDARIDLHGRTQSEAHAALLRFLRRAQAKGAKTVLVITGKGGARRQRARRAQAPGADVAGAAGIPRAGGRLRRRRHRPRRRGRALCAGAAGRSVG